MHIPALLYRNQSHMRRYDKQMQKNKNNNWPMRPQNPANQLVDMQKTKYLPSKVLIKYTEYKSFIKWLNKDFTLALQITTQKLLT